MTVLLLAAFSPVRGDSPRAGPEPTGRVTIDGRSFLPGGSGDDDLSTVRRAFETFGADGSPPGDPPALPGGLTADHVIRLDSPAGPVDLVLGRMHGRGSSIRTRLAADGWEGPVQGEATGSPLLLEKRTGKETTIVCLDEAEGTFLLVRESGR